MTSRDSIFLSYQDAFFELSRINGGKSSGASDRDPSGENQTLSNFFYAGHTYHIKTAWKKSSICLSAAEHIYKEILRPSYFLDNLMGLFDPKVVSKLVQQNIALVILQNRVYATRKLQQNRWLAVQVLSRTKLGDSVVLDEHGNIVETIQRSQKHQIRINRRRRFDTKIIAAFTP